MDISDRLPKQMPPPIPGMRPPLGSPGGPVPAPKSSMGFVMPIYTICIIVFFVYTLTKIMFRRQGSPYDPVAPDPQFRRRVFRDDSRSSPEKLGKKEADTIVTAISGLVAEVQQQMEASAAPNQQRQDVQDNARPYTNGTILLNSGPVQIVTSEYKEVSKEKSPEPVTEKESIPEPKEAEAIKVVTEPRNDEAEVTTGPKEYLPEVDQPSPEPQECKTTPETVVPKSSPEPPVGEDSKESSPIPEVAEEVILDPLPNLPVTPSISKSYVESSLELSSDLKESPHSKESTLELEAFLASAPESNLPEAPKDIGLIMDSEEISREQKVSPPSTSNELTTQKELLTEFIEPTTEPEPLLSERKEPISESKEYSPELVNPIPESQQAITECEKLVLKDSTLESNEPICELKESLAPLTESSSKLEQSCIESDVFLLESNETSPELKDLSLDSTTSTNDPHETVPIPVDSGVQPKELESEDLAFQLEKNQYPIPQKSEESIPDPKDSSLDLKGLLIEIKDSSLESKQSVLDSISDSNNLPELGVAESITSSLNINEPIHDPEIIIPKPQTVTEDLSQFIPDYKESTHKESTSDLTENSQEVKAPIVECSTDPEITQHSPEIEAPIVECSPKPEFIEHLSKIEAPIVDLSPETKITEYSPEVESETLRLKEPTPQYKESTPERKPTEESKTIQIEGNVSVPEGTILDLEEAIADVDDRTEKQEVKESKEQINEKASDELLKTLEETKAANIIKDDLAEANDQFLQGERFVVVRRSTPDVIEENKKLHASESKPTDDFKLYTDDDEEDMENAAVKVMGMEMTAHPADGGEWPRDERPPPPAAPASPPPRAPRAGEQVQSIFLDTEIPQQSRVLVAQFQEDRPTPAAHAPLVVSGKMTLSLIQDAPRETPERDPESTVDEFTTASAVTQPAAEKDEIESDEEIEEEIEVEEIELEEEEEEEEEEPPPARTGSKK